MSTSESQRRRRFAAQEKVAILRQPLVEKVPVSDVCDRHGLNPTQFHRWQKALFPKLPPARPGCRRGQRGALSRALRWAFYAGLMVGWTARVAAAGGAGETASFPVVDGDRRAVIVGDGQYLRRTVEACTGVRLRQVPEEAYRARDGALPIYVGDTAKARQRLAEQIGRLDIEGYILLVEPTYAIIYAGAPKTDTGDPRLWAEGDFCRRFMGADHYLPGELGTVRPTRERVLVPCGLWVEQPAFKHRQWSGYRGAAHRATWRLRASGGGGRFKYHHNLYRIIDPAKYRDHPEYFPVIYAEAGRKPSSPLYDGLQPGQRYVPADRPAAYWQPCTSNPDVQRLVVEAALAAIVKEPDNPTFSLGINDSAGFCVCPKCVEATPAGVDPYSRQASAYRFFDFYNQVAGRVTQRYPNARLGFLAYSHLGSAHPRQRLHRLLMPYRTLSFADTWDPAYRQRLYTDMAAWSEGAAHFGLYEYYYGKGFLIPRIYLHPMAAGLREAHRLGAEGFYAEAYANWGLDGPKLWVTEKLLWDPAQDVDALIDQWCTGLFDEAARQMRAYFDHLESVWVTQQPAGKRRGMYRLMGSRYKKEQFTELFTPEACDRAWGLLGRAEAAARQEIVRKRIAYFRDSFGATRLASNRYRATRRLDAMAEADRPGPRTPGGQARPLVDWLVELEGWAALGSLDAYMDALRAKAPYAFHEFSQEAAVNRTRETGPVGDSFAAWDSEVPALRTIVDRIIGTALETKPQSKADLDSAVNAVLERATAKAAAAGRSVDHVIEVLRPLCGSMALQAGTLDRAPVIDGRIEPEVWGEPQFDGRFYRYPYMAVPAAETTRVWCKTLSRTLYVAFHCRQDPEAVRDRLGGRDDVPLRDRQGRRYVILSRAFPYLSGVDSVGVSLPDRRIAMVTAAGGLFDGQGTARGTACDWDGCTAGVACTADGWCAELVLDLGKESFLTRAPGGIHRLNFFRTGGGRTRGGVRSAWVPATPQRWAIDPRTRGVVFFSGDTTPE